MVGLAIAGLKKVPLPRVRPSQKYLYCVGVGICGAANGAKCERTEEGERQDRNALMFTKYILEVKSSY